MKLILAGNHDVIRYSRHQRQLFSQTRRHFLAKKWHTAKQMHNEHHLGSVCALIYQVTCRLVT